MDTDLANRPEKFCVICDQHIGKNLPTPPRKLIPVFMRRRELKI